MSSPFKSGRQHGKVRSDPWPAANGERQLRGSLRYNYHLFDEETTSDVRVISKSLLQGIINNTKQTCLQLTNAHGQPEAQLF